MTDADPRSAEPVAAPPLDEEPSTTGVVVADDDGDPSGGAPPADQQTALQDAVDRGEAEGSAAAGA